MFKARAKPKPTAEALSPDGDLLTQCRLFLQAVAFRRADGGGEMWETDYRAECLIAERVLWLTATTPEGLAAKARVICIILDTERPFIAQASDQRGIERLLRDLAVVCGRASGPECMIPPGSRRLMMEGR